MLAWSYTLQYKVLLIMSLGDLTYRPAPLRPVPPLLTSRFLRLFLLAVLLFFAIVALFVFWVLWHFPDFSPEYGIRLVNFPDGHRMYFKLKVWGLLGDSSLMVLSPNPDPCAKPDPETDWIWWAYDPAAFMRFSGNTLQLYPLGAVGSPTGLSLPGNVELLERHPLDYDNSPEALAEEGFVPAHVQLNPRFRCK